MSLKELTQHQHQRAESTPFMKAVFAGRMPLQIWADYTRNKLLWYTAIETQAKQLGLLYRLPGIERSNLLSQDYADMLDTCQPAVVRSIAQDYSNYIMSLSEPDAVMAHLYTWHMGDLSGGQLIRQLIPAPSRSLCFENADQLRHNIRMQLTDSMAPEANCAFEWAIKILNEYELENI